MSAQVYFTIWGAMTFGIGAGLAMGSLISPMPRWFAPVVLVLFWGMAFVITRYGVEWSTVSP